MGNGEVGYSFPDIRTGIRSISVLGYNEKQVNMELTLKMKNHLESLGYSIVMTNTPIDNSLNVLTASLEARA